MVIELILALLFLIGGATLLKKYWDACDLIEALRLEVRSVREDLNGVLGKDDYGPPRQTRRMRELEGREFDLGRVEK